MNKKSPHENEELLCYQRDRFQGLMQEIVECCEGRTAYLSGKFNLPQAEVRCLLLFSEERYFTVKGIAGKLEVAKSRVTKIVDGLIHKKLVMSVNDPKDARVKLISLTPEGRRKMREIDEFNADLHQKLLMEIGPDERKAVLSALELLRSGMEAVKRQMV